MKHYIEFCPVILKTSFTMAERIRTKTTFITMLSLLFLTSTLLLNLLFPNLLITHLILGIAIIVGLVQLKKANL
jgi:hypothetical protein